MNVKELYDYVLDQSLAVVAQVHAEQLAFATPDTDWSVRDLLQHMLSELVWLPDILAGKTMAEVGSAHDGDLLGEDAAHAWRQAVAAARAAVQSVDVHATVHLSYADKPAGDYLLESADDILVHSWDLGQAIGVSVVFDETWAQVLYSHMVELRQRMSASSVFAEPLAVAETASTQTKLLGLLGRSENWH